MTANGSRPIPAKRVVEAVTAVTGVSRAELLGLRGFAHVTNARRVLYASLRASGMSWPAIAHTCGRKAHTTPYNALKALPVSPGLVRAVMEEARR